MNKRLKIILLLAAVLLAGCATDPVQRVYQYRATFAVAESGLVRAHHERWITDAQFRATKAPVMAARDMLNAAEIDALTGMPLTQWRWTQLKSAVGRVVDLWTAAKRGRQ